MLKNFSIIFILATYYLLLAATTFAQSTPWSIQRDTADAYKLKFWYNSLSASPLTITTDGKIGIGTAIPLQLLQINGTNPLVQISNTSTGFNGIKFTATGGWQVGFGTNQAAGYWYDFSNDLGTTHQLYFNGTNWIFPTGKIGIGTATPAYTLDVNGTTRTLGSDVFAQSNNTSTSYNDAPIQIREAQYGASVSYLPPRLSFHWGGVVASQIAIEQDGTIAIRNNPGTAYEKFKSSMITDTGSKVGIGTRNPTAPLTVTGGNIDIEANRTIYSPGRMHVFGEEILYLLNKSGVVVSKAWGGNGNFSVEGTKNFEIPHPLDPEKRLVHSSLEGPEAAVFYRGEGQLIKGEAEVILPNYFEALTRPDNRTVTLTAKGKTPYLLSTEEVKNGKFKVYGTQPDGKFYWEVKAVRKDVPPLQVEKPKT